MAKRTKEEIDAMELEVIAYREEERREADAAAREAASEMLALLNEGTLQRVLDALLGLDSIPTTAARLPTLRSGANALRVGLESVMSALRSIPIAD